MSESTPNPGSKEARALGCRCPVMDNNSGKWAPRPPDGWWISMACELHAWKAKEELINLNGGKK